MSGSQRTDANSAEAGFTLVELIIYISLSVVILSLVGGFLLNGVRADRDVKSAAQAANSAQLIAESIKRDVRNATRVEVVNENTLVLRTAGVNDPSALSCRSWYFDSGSQAIYSANVGVATSPTIDRPWIMQGEGISEIDAAPVFTRDHDSVRLSFTVNGATAVHVQTTVTPRAPAEIEATCFAD